MRKICTKCGIEKEINFENFNRLSKSKDGFRPNCKECHKSQGIIYNKINAKERAFKEKQRRLADPIKQKEKQKRNYWRHKEKSLKYNAEWRKKNWFHCKLESKVKQANKKAKYYGVDGIINRDIVYRVLMSEGFCCHYCKQKMLFGNMTIDHDMPMSRGGDNKESNLLPACTHCNSSKKSKTKNEYLKYLEMIKTSRLNMGFP